MREFKRMVGRALALATLAILILLSAGGTALLTLMEDFLTASQKMERGLKDVMDDLAAAMEVAETLKSKTTS